MQIPKVIHYCWFGGHPLGEKEIECVESWKTYMSDYEIIQWDESNFDINCNKYVREAYESGKWAFVSDYARFQILYQYGGIYFDNDVELIKPMDDIIEYGPFMGCEDDATGVAWSNLMKNQKSITVNSGLGLSAYPGMKLYKTILESYNSDSFVLDDDTLNEVTVVVRVTNILKSEGLRNNPGIQHIAGVTIYPAEYFNPKSFETGKTTITEKTKSIHHFNMSWLSSSEKKWTQRRHYFGSKYGGKGIKFYKVISFPYRVSKILNTRGISGLKETVLNKINTSKCHH